LHHFDLVTEGTKEGYSTAELLKIKAIYSGNVKAGWKKSGHDIWNQGADIISFPRYRF
jgi:hypothetical protein